MDMRARRRPGHRELRRGRTSLPNHIYHVTSATLGREPRFRDFAAACAASRCFERHAVLCDTTMLAWVLMPDHVHWLVQLGTEGTLHGVIRRLKAASAREANRALGRRAALWAPSYLQRALRAGADVAGVARYIVANPLRAGLVETVRDYPFWDAVWLDRKSVV